MLCSRLAKHGTRLALAVILGLALVGNLPMPAQAASPVNLVLGGEGATSWNISNIKPGDSGAKTVELHNAGSRKGSVTIWVGDIVSSEGANPESETGDTAEPGELTSYLLFNLSCSRLSTNLLLPATIDGLPQSVSGPGYIKVRPLNPGETVTLVWEWEFPETGAPQNDAQGDSLSFTINYLLEELPSGGGGGGGTPNYQWLTMDILGAVTPVRVSSSGELLDSFVASGPDNKSKLELDQGTKVTCAGGLVPIRIEMRVCEEPLSAPDGTEIIGPAYSLTGYVYDSAPCPLIFEPPALLTLNYDPAWLPEGTSSVLIASYGAEQGWRELELPFGGVAEPGEITTLISHTSIFAILARLTPSPSYPVLSPPLLPAKFELNDFVINPAQLGVGEPVAISTTVQNTGEAEGNYTLTLKINGKIEQSKETTLAGGESTRVSFTVTKDNPGTYAVAVDGLTGEFIVLASASPPWVNLYWWLLLLAVVVAILLTYFLTIGSRHRPQ